jgi:hypothetical protein
VDEKATQLHAIASLKVLLDATKPQDGINGTGGGAATGDLAQDSGRASQGTEVMIITFDSIVLYCYYTSNAYMQSRGIHKLQ